jgi:hypothetical protein
MQYKNNGHQETIQSHLHTQESLNHRIPTNDPRLTNMAHRIRAAHNLLWLQHRASGPPLSPPSLAPGRQLRIQYYQVRLSSTVIPQSEDDAVLAKKTSAFGSPPLTWPHKGWDDKVVLEVIPSHRKPRTLNDRIAWRVISICR